MTKTVTAALAFAAALLASASWAQDEPEGTIETLASEEEVQAVSDTISLIGCEAPFVEKESDDLFEIDDADCGPIGQFDIKLVDRPRHMSPRARRPCKRLSHSHGSTS